MSFHPAVLSLCDDLSSVAIKHNDPRLHVTGPPTIKKILEHIQKKKKKALVLTT